MFTLVRTRRSFEEALDQIAERITTGDLQVGDRLPPEREIAAAMGISRPTLREALKVLSAAGVIEVRSRSGGMIVRKDLIPVDVIADRRQHVLEEAGSVLEVRRTIECSVGRIAATEASEEDLAALERTIELQREAGADVRRHLQLDERFHLTMARATRNPMYSELVRTILRRLTVVRDMTPRRPGDQEQEIGIHERTLAALRTRDVAQVDVAMDEHMSFLEDLWEQETGGVLRRSAP